MKLHFSILQLLMDSISALKIITQTVAKPKTNPQGAEGNSVEPGATCSANPREKFHTGSPSRSKAGDNNNGEEREIHPQTEAVIYDDEESQEKILALLKVFEKKLQNSLMSLIKLYAQSKCSKKR